MSEDEKTPARPLQFIPRRRVLQGGAVAAGAALASFTIAGGASANQLAAQQWVRGNLIAAQSTPESYTPAALTDAELATIKAAMARIIPADDLGPGAVEFGAYVYLDKFLAGSGSAVLPLYQGGVKALDTAAGSGGFAGLAAADQDAILTKAEAGKLDGAPDGFFATLLEHTREGSFGDPIRGGNAKFGGWDLIGYPGIKLSWTADEQQIGAVVKPEHISVEQYGGKAQ